MNENKPQKKISGVCKLENSKIDLKGLREKSIKRLIDIIDQTNPTKRRGLIVGKELLKNLDIFVEISYLKENGINFFYTLENKIESPAEIFIFLIEPHKKEISMISDLILNDSKVGIKRQYLLVFTPRKMDFCSHFLEEQGIYGSMRIHDLDMVFFFKLN